uniref:Uncharacterized protein n=1 Tax=Trypanosoma congolense (strain IL3000) TaxID=1068625 RepID=G0URD4_TRYCI|nr:hypothetical protein, unlikely [Trypanosoma congolense IL3000]
MSAEAACVEFKRKYVSAFSSCLIYRWYNVIHFVFYLFTICRGSLRSPLLLARIFLLWVQWKMGGVVSVWQRNGKGDGCTSPFFYIYIYINYYYFHMSRQKRNVVMS